MSTSPFKILVLGGAGAQNCAVARELVKNTSFSVTVLSRDIQSKHSQGLATLPGISLLEGDCYDEETLVSAFRGVDGCFVNTNGFAIGEKAEIFWGIRMYEIAYAAGVKHFVYSSLPYVSKKSGFNPKYYVPFVDGKGKVADYLKAQPTDRMNWTLLESGPYAESQLVNSYFPTKDEQGVWVFQNPIGHNGALALVCLQDFGWFARYVFEKPEEFRGDLLSVGIDHVSGTDLARAWSAVTREPSRFEPLDLLEVAKTWPTANIGQDGSPGFNDPTLKNMAGHFVPWFTIWSESGGNKGLWTKDYERLDRIYPERIRTIEQWMRYYDYPSKKGVNVLNSGLGLATFGDPLSKIRCITSLERSNVT
ncbi:NAD(P)-binding protein [Thozetella sp. PMI_491]|nr:NAD(P)-binding protein [Thozetella sp. PMI_491]